ncbi:hypothetical protein OHB12_00525 [Nocardia sp. NBC_01730]|uniref:hypothetical protein n=1 Tax=Nocardia sp. NBC_01730 TaxID=2975998 RepID=UPI002E0D9536|nr:hypothetical protein OHB12_00525 [Nocardia sp. NBC_01730]
MSEPHDTYDPPQDTGPPDSVETDPAALSSAEDLDEDRLCEDPLERGMDPPEHWSGATKYGMTPWEEGHPRPLDERLAEEEPDTPIEPSQPKPPSDRYEEGLGIFADIAGASVPQDARTPEPPE